MKKNLLRFISGGAMLSVLMLSLFATTQASTLQFCYTDLVSVGRGQIQKEFCYNSKPECDVAANNVTLCVQKMVGTGAPGVGTGASGYVSSDAGSKPLVVKFLAPLPGVANTDLIPYLVSMVTLLIGIAGVLAVIRLVICGFELLTAPGASQREHAKDCLWKVVLGLLLILSGYILLQSINPELNKPKLDLPAAGSLAGPVGGSRQDPLVPGWYFSYVAAKTGNEVNSAKYDTQLDCENAENAKKAAEPTTVITRDCFNVPVGVVAGTVTCPGASSPIPASWCPDASSPDLNYTAAEDASVRAELAKVGVGVNSAMCKDTCSCGCTNVGGLSSSVVDELEYLKKTYGGNPVITGGTEAHLHKSHQLSGATFDLRKGNAAIDAAIYKGQKQPSFGNYYKYLSPTGDFWYTDETGNPPHWHVTP